MRRAKDEIGKLTKKEKETAVTNMFAVMLSTGTEEKGFWYRLNPKTGKSGKVPMKKSK
jgi:hypothetical protein